MDQFIPCEQPCFWYTLGWHTGYAQNDKHISHQ
jgi:hypothetical protein